MYRVNISSRRNSRRGASRIKKRHKNTEITDTLKNIYEYTKEYLFIVGLIIVVIFGLYTLINNIAEKTKSKKMASSIKEELIVDISKDIKPKILVNKQSKNVLNKSAIAKQLNFPAGMNVFPRSFNITTDLYSGNVEIDYTINEKLQNKVTSWLTKYNSDFAAMVVLDADTGKLEALASHVSNGDPYHNLALNAYYPGASIFKIVTAAAAINEGIYTPSSILKFNGKSTTLYKSQIEEVVQNKWTRNVTLTESFAKSINPVFGRIGKKDLGAGLLTQYANVFGFNNRFITDLEISPSITNIDNNDPWTIVEAASGYTQTTLLSPVHGALIAASVVNGGKLNSPYWINKVETQQKKLLYKGNNTYIHDVMTQQTAEQMKILMRETITKGTARKSFRTFLSQAEKYKIDMGGKTGTLRGRGPKNEIKGLHDWFVGYASQGDKNIAFAILNVSKDKWKVKSHFLAKELIKYYFIDKEKYEAIH